VQESYNLIDGSKKKFLPQKRAYELQKEIKENKNYYTNPDIKKVDITKRPTFDLIKLAVRNKLHPMLT